MYFSKYVYMCTVCLCTLCIAVHASENQKQNDGFDYSHYEKVLNTYVYEDGMVDYDALKENPDDLNAFMDQLANQDPQKFQTWPEDAQLAFWINAYNGITLKTIINHYPIEASFFGSLRFPDNSIRQIDGVWDEITHNVMGRQMTLDNIEHDTIRVDFDEPKIHFAVNCASIGCPRLKDEPYVGERLDEQFDEQINWFVNTPYQFRIEDDTVSLSKILDWYGEDFVGHDYGDRFSHLNNTEQPIMNLLYSYLSEAQKIQIEGKRIDVDYIDYDWSLNEYEGN